MNSKPTLITAERFTQIIIDHVKGGRIHAVYSLVLTRDAIWADALAATQEPARFDGEVALEEFEAKPGKCARCGFSREDHSYNGACYGLCGKFVEVKK